MPRLKAILLLSLATLLAPALMLGQSANPAEPGTLNYVEGQVSINGQVVNWSSVGFTALNEGQVIETGNGKAEVLLAPGVFLRVGDNSAVRMISPNLANTEVELIKGRADVEVDQLFKQNDLRVRMKGDEARLLKTGLYAFDSELGTVQVFDGEAEVLPVDGQQKPIVVKDGHQLAMNGDGEKPKHFDKEASEDALYNWSSLRSQYLGEANVQLASEYEGVPGFAPGWFWDGGLYGYTWLPGDGAFFDPFGYGFYSPYYLYGGGFVYGYGRGYGRGGYRGAYRQGQTGFHSGRAGGFHGGYGGGFHGDGGFGGGGFHGGGGHR
ncbi:FecR domain-containing protein [Alloacidobacterium dinghuense]|uniref:FecR domain-containing protein n=1 Tax=Alloacidobacterium dinghuense TaxID=2763107 RepID=A0A7G8BNT4_9BACT|nr:FecR domain-containing protein [Alloacidobacterium dinghuense]QNI34204.1 FecR domain-containing protein [Alloacidobacterium dinghuense]